VWSLRSTHSGNATLLRFPWWAYPEPGRDGKYPKWQVANKANGDRIAIFAALGLDDAHHNRYTKYLKTRSYMVDVWRRSSYDDDVLARAADVGLKVRNLPQEIDGDMSIGQHRAWAPLPY
jgi:hypothetical protein